MTQKEMSNRFLRYRAMHKLSQSQFADLIGETMNMVWRVENGFALTKANTLRIQVKLEELERGETVHG